jgi:CBS-domain-containing membrane protein
MSRAQVRRVPVVNKNDELVGIVSIGDLATETNKDGKVGQTIEDISRGSANN